MKKHGLAVVIIVALVLLIGYYFAAIEVNISDTHTLESSTGNQDLSSVIVPTSSNNHQTFDSDSFRQCVQLTSDVSNYRWDWTKQRHESWGEFIDNEEYSLNDVTLAIEYFTNSNFAETFRVTHIRKNAPLTEMMNSLRQQMLDVMPTFFDSGFRVHPQLPQPFLDGFETLPYSEKVKVIEENEVIIDDVAYVLLEPSFSDNDIIMLINALRSTHELVAYDKYAAVSLLDYAIIASRPEIVEILLNMGHEPTHDEYLGSSMEWALSRLPHSFSDSRMARAVDVVKLLLNENGQARFNTKSLQIIEGTFPGNFYEFNEEQISWFAIEHNLDLTQIQTREVIAVDQNLPLIKRLKAEQIADYAKENNLPDVESLLPVCTETLSELEALWQPEHANTIIARTLELFGDDEYHVRRELSTIDPFLTDVFDRRQAASMPKGRISNELRMSFDSAYELFIAGKVSEGIDLVLSKGIPEGKREWVMLHMFRLGERYYNSILASQLHTELTNYGALRSFRLLNKRDIMKLSDAGLNIYNKDGFGKTLVYYAAHARDIELLDWLYENNFTYGDADNGQDPLHTALNITRKAGDLDGFEDTIDRVMQFNPAVDNHHLSRMALIKIYYPETYSRLTAKYSELEVTEGSVALPPVSYGWIWFS